MPDIPRIEVDFNDFEDDGRLGALASSADDASALEPGVLVTLWDEDGNAAQGRVSELGDRGQVWIDVLRPTWRSASEMSAEHVVSSGFRDATSSVVFFTIRSAGLVEPFEAAATPTVYFDPMLIVVPSMHGRVGAAVLHRAGWPVGLNFAESYKLRSVVGTAPVTAELAP
jgi:hypothetical protein